MNIYIEHTDGKFYDYCNISFNNLLLNFAELSYPDGFLTDKRDFEIGSRVYFQGIGWTEVVEQEGCKDCCLKLERCNLSRTNCLNELRNDKQGVIFKKLEQTETKEEQTVNTGQKFDDEKIRMDLLPFEALEAVAEVLTFGAKKYADNNWQLVENAKSRYVAALLRHLSAYMQNEINDKESGFSHIAHMATNALFLVWLDERAKREIKQIIKDEDNAEI